MSGTSTLPRHFKTLIKIPALKPSFRTLTVTDSSTQELKILEGRKGLMITSMIKMAIE
jgi:hypothetical protein